MERRAVRGRAVHTDPRRDLSLRSASTARARSSTSGPTAPRSSALVTTSTTSSCSRTAGPRSEPRSRTPHGQIYAYDHVPSPPGAPARRRVGARQGGRTSGSIADRRRLAPRGCRTRPPSRSRSRWHPIERIPDLPSMPGAARDGLATILIDVLGTTRPDVRPTPALHDVAQPTADDLHRAPTRQPGTNRRVVQHRDRVTVAAPPASSASSPRPRWRATSTSTR